MLYEGGWQLQKQLLLKIVRVNFLLQKDSSKRMYFTYV